MPIKEKIWKK